MKNNFGYRLLTPIMRVLFRIYYNPKIVNKDVIPLSGSIVIACNHKHLFDQCLTIMATHRPINYMAKKEYFEGRLSWFFKFVGCIPVDRSKKDESAKEQALSILKNGGAIGIFPEGTRNRHKDRLLLDFKFGAVSLASKSNALVIPCAITGDYKFRSKNLIIRYGEPFKVSGNLHEANDKLRDEVSSLLDLNMKETGRILEDELNTHEV